MTENSAQVRVFSEDRFDQLELHPSIKKSLDEAGFEQMTPIQAQSLPLALSGHDIAGQGQTGTGKTAAFLIAAFQRILSSDPPVAGDDMNPRAIMIAPTRELAIQIHRDAELLGKYTGLRLALAYGGIDYEKQRSHIAAGCDILIGTPGRIIDYFKQRVYNLNNIQVLVLDEADRMFDLGFIADIRFLFRRMPPPNERLNLLFSATLSHRVAELGYEHMNDPTRVEIESEQMTADKVRQVVYMPAMTDKIPLLLSLLKSMDASRTMVFCNTKVVVEKVCAYLNANGFQAEVLSGDVRQKKRQTLLKRFHDGDLAILVATDVAARGLHIPDVSHVFNYDLPNDPEDYVHRVGRTARLGQSGDAVSFACEDSAFYLPEIESYVGHRIDVEGLPALAETVVHSPRRKRREPDDRHHGRGKPHGRSGSNRPPRRDSGDGSRGKGPEQSGQVADGDAPKKKRRRRRKPKARPESTDGSNSNTTDVNGNK